MADDSVVHDDDDVAAGGGGDESKIVTQFLLDTCRLHQPSEHHVGAAGMCVLAVSGHPCFDTTAECIPLVTGSAAEFYIQPMLRYVNDIDLMWHKSNELAIPDGHQPPSQLPAEFDSRVAVFEISDSEYPGYVYLVLSHILTENVHAGRSKYDAEQYDGDHWYTPNIRYHFDISPSIKHLLKVDGPALSFYHPFSHDIHVLDLVASVRCLSWPTQAANWPKRHKNYGWPDKVILNRVVGNGCDLVQVAHRQCRQDKWEKTNQWRLSFSRAEIVLLNSWMPVQQIVYHMLRFFMKIEELYITDNTGSKIISNYHIKTLMLWACEMKPGSWWTDDLDVIRICVELLNMLTKWLKNKKFLHYFLNNYRLIDTSLHVKIVTRKLVPVTESWLSKWFVDNYLRKCAALCPQNVSFLFHDVSTSIKLQHAVSAVVEWRRSTGSALDYWDVLNIAEKVVSMFIYFLLLNVPSSFYWIKELEKIDLCFLKYFNAHAFLHIACEASMKGLSDELTDVLTSILGQFIGKRRSCNQLSSTLLLSQAAKLMKVVVNNSRSTVQLIEIELSKAYLYRALRCKDSDSDSIYCLANVYLAVLYYTTGHYQTAIDHCTQVTRSQDHSQCSSHVVQGELLPKIDDNINTVLGLAVFYQYVRTAALNQQQQTQCVSVFTTNVFAHYLHIRCLSVMKCCHFSLASDAEGQRYRDYSRDAKQLFIADVLLLKSVDFFSQKYQRLTEQRRKATINLADVLLLELMKLSDQTCYFQPATEHHRATELDTSKLVELLQQSAVEHLTTYRQLEAEKFGSVATIVTTDFEALYAYKRGDYERCLQLFAQNVHMLLYADQLPAFIQIFPQFNQLMEDDIVSLIALTLIINPDFSQWLHAGNHRITQLTLSLYLMTQCQLKLHHTAWSLLETLDYIEVAQRRHPVDMTLNHLALKLAKRKAEICLASMLTVAPCGCCYSHKPMTEITLFDDDDDDADYHNHDDDDDDDDVYDDDDDIPVAARAVFDASRLPFRCRHFKKGELTKVTVVWRSG